MYAYNMKYNCVIHNTQVTDTGDVVIMHKTLKLAVTLGC